MSKYGVKLKYVNVTSENADSIFNNCEISNFVFTIGNKLGCLHLKIKKLDIISNNTIMEITCPICKT